MEEEKKQNLMSITQYASKCGVSRMQIYNRISAGLIVPIIYANQFYGLLIDANIYPPQKKQTAGRKQFKKL